MRDYGSVHTRFWSNSDIQTLSDQAKLLALYLLTGPHTNMLGCFRLPIGYVAEDLNWSSETVSKRFTELFQKGFITRDETSAWVLIPRFLEWNPIENPNQAKSLRKLFDQVPEKSVIYRDLIDVLLIHNKHFDEAFFNRLETLSKGFAEPFRNQDQNQEQKQEQKQDQDQKQDIGGAQSTSDCLPETVTPTISQTVCEIFSSIAELKPIIAITLNDKTEFPILQQQIDEWQQLYPAVDVLQTLRNIRAWNSANPARRKTRSGILRHIVAWLTKEQNQGGNTREKTIVTHDARSVNQNNLAAAQRWLNKSEQTVVEGEVVITALSQEVKNGTAR